MNFDWNAPLINGHPGCPFFSAESYAKYSVTPSDAETQRSDITVTDVVHAALPTTTDVTQPHTVESITPQPPAKTTAIWKQQAQDACLNLKVPFPRPSSLTREEQRMYLELSEKFTENVPSSLEEVKQLNFLNELHKKVVEEQEEFMKYLEEIAQKDADDYNSIHPVASSFIEDYLACRRERVQKYPRFYTTLDTVPLSLPKQSGEIVFQHIETLLEMGLVPKAFLPKIGTTYIRPKLLLKSSKMTKRYPVTYSAQDSSRLPVVSEDKNAEILALKYHANIVISSSSLSCLLDNQAPQFLRQWEMPVIIKEHVSPSSGDDNLGNKLKVVYVDKPFVAKTMTNYEKNLLYHRLSLKTSILHPAHTLSFYLEGKVEFLNEVEMEPAKSLPGEIGSCLFESSSTSLDDLETFGISTTRQVTIRNKTQKQSPPENFKLRDHQPVPLPLDNASQTDTCPEDCTSSDDEDVCDTQPLSPIISTDGQFDDKEADVPLTPTRQSKRLAAKLQKSPGSSTAKLQESSDDTAAKLLKSPGSSTAKLQESSDDSTAKLQKNPGSSTAKLQESSDDSTAKLLKSDDDKTGFSSWVSMRRRSARVSQSSRPSDCGSDSDSDSQLVIDLASPAAKLSVSKDKHSKMSAAKSDPVSLDGLVTGGNALMNTEDVKSSVSDKKETENVNKGNTILSDNDAVPKHLLQSSEVMEKSVDHNDGVIAASCSQTDAEMSVKKISSCVLENSLATTVAVLHEGTPPAVVMTAQQKGDNEYTTSRKVSSGSAQSAVLPTEKQKRRQSIVTNSSVTSTNDAPSHIASSDLPLSTEKDQNKRSNVAHVPAVSTCYDSSANAPTDVVATATVQQKRTRKGVTDGTLADVEVPVKRKRGRPRKNSLQPPASDSIPMVIAHPKVTPSQRLLTAGKSADLDGLSSTVAKSISCNTEPPLTDRKLPDQEQPMTTCASAVSVGECDWGPGRRRIARISSTADRKPTSSAVTDKLPAATASNPDASASQLLSPLDQILVDQSKMFERTPLLLSSHDTATAPKLQTVTKNCSSSLVSNQHSPSTDNIIQDASGGMTRTSTLPPSESASATSVTSTSMHPQSLQTSQSDDEHKMAEDPQQYSRSSQGNVAYHLWKLGNLRIIIRYHYHGVFETQRRRSAYFVHLTPKLEYQLVHGYEQLSYSEAVAGWLALQLRNSTRLVRARVDARTSEIVLFDTLSQQEFQKEIQPFNPVPALTTVNTILNKLTSLEQGCHLISHMPGNPHMQIKKTAKTQCGVYDLHLAYQTKTDVTKNVPIPWMPINTLALLPYHIKYRRIPCTFEPKDSAMVNTVRTNASFSNQHFNKAKKKKKNKKF